MHDFYEFGPFVVDTVQQLLLREQKPVPLGPKAYDTLLFLVQNRGRMLSKDALMKALWPDSFVEESNLTVQISTIRRAFGVAPSEDCYIVTVPGRGYRFAAPVRGWSERKPGLMVEEATGRAAAAVGALDKSDRPIEDNGRTAATSDRARNTAAVRMAPRLEVGACTARDALETPRSPEAAGPIQDTRPTDVLKMRPGKPVAFALLSVALVALGYFLHRGESARVHPRDGQRSLAILPFQNLKRDAASDFLGISLADAVITKLGYVRALTVRPSSAIEKYRNEVIDIRKVAADLNVDTLVTSNFIRDGDDLRITSQLIDVKTERILWTGALNLKYEKLLTVQDKVAQMVIKGLELNLPPSEVERFNLTLPLTLWPASTICAASLFGPESSCL